MSPSLREAFYYTYGYVDAFIPRSLTDFYGRTIASTAKLISLPLPLLSFIALPLFGGSSTTISLFFFYLTWAAVVFSHSPLEVEVVGSLIVRLVFFLFPALAFLIFDYIFPGTAKSIKTYGASAVPQDRDRLLKIAGVATFNILFSTALQAALEILFTKILLTRSLIKVSTFLPLPLSILQDFLRGFIVRGFLHFWAHRYLLHGGPLKQWHGAWQHSVKLPFSIVAAYDHPACFIVGQFLPTVIPAYLFRFHVLTLHLYLALVSLEQLLIYSGYNVLPSRIILGGMARRIDAHFYTYGPGKASNFGHWGVLDLVYRTGCKESVDLLNDIQTEASKHRVKERASAAVEGAKIGVEEEERSRKPRRSKDTSTSDEVEDADAGKLSGIRRKLPRRR